ncbi:MAG TPA: DUF6011 domain-containing protein, partial [Dehalococcoidia bacterium]|nr:DUF6011 domain-containing protein [Dehalococcoidia bacterium]
MTYWRWAPGSLSPWPEKARYGPWATRGDHPPFHTEEYTTWVRALARDLDRYHATVKAAIEADPVTAGKRFADFASRCCICSKTLTDTLSKTYGNGPDCCSGMS